MTTQLNARRFSAWVTLDMDTGRLHVVGDLDLTSAALVQAQLGLLLQAGVGPQVIDLSRVTTLSSAGTRVLDAVRDLAPRTGIELEIVSDPGTVGERYAMAGQSPTT